MKNVLAVVPIQQTTQPAEDRSLFAPATPQARHGGDNPVRHPAQGKRLQPDPPGSAQRRKEQPFAAEQRRLDLADVLNLVADGRLKGDDAPGVHPDQLAGRQSSFVERAAGVNEAPAVPCRFCMMNPSPPNSPTPSFL